MSWLSNHWKKLIIGGCGIVGAVATVVPAAVPVAAICALVVPAVAGAPTVVDAVKSLIVALGPKSTK